MHRPRLGNSLPVAMENFGWLLAAKAIGPDESLSACSIPLALEGMRESDDLLHLRNLSR